MKMIRLFAVSVFFAAILSVSVFAQTSPAQPASGKIAVINTYLFGDEKAGITKYISAVNALNTEFKPLDTELQTLVARYQTLSKEIQTLRDQATANNGKVPIDEKAAQAKVDEAEKLERDIKFKQEDAKAKFEKRQQTVLGPIMQDIYKAVQEFSKQKGYMMILDIGKMADADIVMALDEKADVTKDFITFYNARPATTATTSTPK